MFLPKHAVFLDLDMDEKKKDCMEHVVATLQTRNDIHDLSENHLFGTEIIVALIANTLYSLIIFIVKSS